ncbi:MAG: beta-lactamase family protein [Acidobacteria bacterium]|nr:beta-lactamase family protein [Acidobacteriota bacterium]
MRVTVALFLLALTTSLFAQDPAAIDKAVTDVLARSGAPSASIAVVKDGKLLYAKAYGNARLDPPMAATADMRYSIGSISKQFTAAAVLLLAEEGKLTLDDKVVRWLPELTRAQDVTIRQLLSMTSGYQDFWPQDYVMPMMMKPVAPDAILNGWAKIPLDFEPGTKWQYSNTNYVIAGLIVERVAGLPLLDFLKKRVFEPLKMTSVTNTDEAPLGPTDPSRYMRFALAKPRLAPKEGTGWMFAAGELAMTARDLAAWDIAMIDQTVLKPASYRDMQTEVLLKSGASSRYGLGVSVAPVEGRRQISHGGEVSGFTARNEVYPDDRAAIVVLTNLDATDASTQIASAIARQLFAGTTDTNALESAKRIFAALQQGKIDRALFTSNANSYFSADALADFASSLGPLGTPTEFAPLPQSLRGGMTLRRYRIRFPNKTLRLTTFTMPDGKLEQYTINASE